MFFLWLINKHSEDQTIKKCGVQKQIDKFKALSDKFELDQNTILAKLGPIQILDDFVAWDWFLSFLFS